MDNLGESISELLGEITRRETANRREIAARFLVNRRLQRADDRKLNSTIDKYLGIANSLQARVLADPKDRPRRYKLLAYLMAAVLLSSDSKGRTLRLKRILTERCSRQGIEITRRTPLWLLAVKAFAPYDRSTPEDARHADQKVSRDHKVIRKAISKGVGPLELVKHSLSGNGLDVSSRRNKSTQDRQSTLKAAVVTTPQGIVVTGPAAALTNINSLPAGSKIFIPVEKTVDAFVLTDPFFDQNAVKIIFNTPISPGGEGSKTTLHGRPITRPTPRAKPAAWD